MARSGSSFDVSENIPLMPSRVRVGYRVLTEHGAVRVIFPPAVQGFAWLVVPAMLVGFVSVPMWPFAVMGLFHHRHDAAPLPVVLLILAAVMIGVLTGAAYLLMSANHREIDLDADSLRTIRKIGPLRFTRSRAAVADVREVSVDQEAVKKMKAVIAAMPDDPNLQLLARSAIGSQSTPLVARTADGETLDLFVGEVAWMLVLAHNLNVQLDHVKHGRSPQMSTPQQRDAAPVDFDSLAIETPSATSGMKLERGHNQMRITLRPLGLLGTDAAKAFTKFALLYFFIVTGILATGGVLYALFHAKLGPIGPLRWAAILYIPMVMWILSLLMIVRLIAKAVDHATIEVTPVDLTIRDRAMLRRRSWRIARQHVMDIQVQATGETMQQQTFDRTGVWQNDIQGEIFALHVLDANGLADDMFAGRDKRDLQWLADTLRVAMGLAPLPTPDDAADATATFRKRRF